MRSNETPPKIRPCVWMTAGLLSYRLCDLDYDCEHCPLDRALHGTHSVRPYEPVPVRPSEIPDDRRYTSSHTWVRPAEARETGTLRTGLDAFAASLFGRARGVEKVGDLGGTLEPGAPYCEIDVDVGAVTIRSPFDAVLVQVNPQLTDDPSLACTDPYERGWLAELRPRRSDGPSLDDASEARRRSGHDLRRLRRQIALAMLVDDSGVGTTLPDGGELVTNLRELLGPRRWLELLRDFVH